MYGVRKGVWSAETLDLTRLDPAHVIRKVRFDLTRHEIQAQNVGKTHRENHGVSKVKYAARTDGTAHGQCHQCEQRI